MGRNLKLVDNNKKHFTKEEIEARKVIEDKASDGLEKLQITEPRHLNPIAKAEYRRIINDLQNLPLRNLDRALLESYCTWYATNQRWQDNKKVLKPTRTFFITLKSISMLHCR